MSGATTVAEPSNAPGDLAGLEKSLKDAANEAKAPDKDAPAKANTGTVVDTHQRPDYIPEKFWTGDEKSSLAKMADGYKNLESAYGRMANDLGTQRKLTDRLLALDKRDTDMGTPPAPPKVDPKDLVNKPTETLDSYWKTREATLRQEFEQKQREDLLARQEAEFMSRHPDAQTLSQTPEFTRWVQEDPFRARTAATAGTGDYSAADELLTQYKSRTKQNQTQNLEAARKAGTESAGSTESAGTSKRIYRRADLIQLKMEKPHVYEDPAFQAEIYKAYQENRVK